MARRYGPRARTRIRGWLSKVPGARRAVTALRRPPTVDSPAAPAVVINAGDGGPTPPFLVTSGVDRGQFAAEVAARSWFHTFDFGGGIVARGADPSHVKAQYLGLPDRLDGMSVLDVGTFDGHYSFEAARRGAVDVLAVDEFVWTLPGASARSNFEFVREHLGLAVRDQVINVEDLSPESIGGVFDVVLFYGVLYHAPDPLGYLRRVRGVTKGYALIETVVDLLDVPRPALAYYEGDYLSNDPTNFFGPNMLALDGMLHDAGFSRVDDLGLWRLHDVEIARGLSLPTGRPVSGRAVVRAWA